METATDKTGFLMYIKDTSVKHTIMATITKVFHSTLQNLEITFEIPSPNALRTGVSLHATEGRQNANNDSLTE